VAGDPEYLTPDATYGTARGGWVPLDGYAPGSPQVPIRSYGERQDALPSQSESVTLGLAIAKNQVRWRMRWRADIDSSMKITLHGDTDVDYQIVGGLAEIEGRKERIEMMLERFSS
jgi:hypothetical protein